LRIFFLAKIPTLCLYFAHVFFGNAMHTGRLEVFFAFFNFLKKIKLGARHLRRRHAHAKARGFLVFFLQKTWRTSSLATPHTLQWLKVHPTVGVPLNPKPNAHLLPLLGEKPT
jgi:hypothetical protein